jgi:hypothetical protein
VGRGRGRRGRGGGKEEMGDLAREEGRAKPAGSYFLKHFNIQSLGEN